MLPRGRSGSRDGVVLTTAGMDYLGSVLWDSQ